jgi:SAM-dependent methyltransferase
LLEFFRKRTPSEADRATIPTLVRRLADPAFAVRERASADLAALGKSAVPFLRKATQDPDREVARRAELCLQAIETEAARGLVAAAARLLKARKPARAAEVLLDFLPFADDEEEKEVLAALKETGVREGGADAVLVAALKDRDSLRRAGAALCVGQSGETEQRRMVRPLLSDPDAKVRLRAAQGLVAGKDKGAVPVLVALLGEAPLPLALQAEDLLGRIAGDQSPDISLGGTDRRKCQEAWARWWNARGAEVDLARVEARRPRLPPIPPVPAGRQPDIFFVPTPRKVVDRMLELAKVKKTDVVYDLGCGDGRVVVTAARKYGAYGFGFEIDPRRVKDSLDNVRKNKVEKLVTIKHADVFTLDLREATVICLYLLPELNVKLIPQLEKLKPGTRILSHDFDMRGVQPDQVVQVQGEGREHTLYLWTTPLKKQER